MDNDVAYDVYVLRIFMQIHISMSTVEETQFKFYNEWFA